MATDDESLMREVRALTGYTDENTFSDIDLLDLINISKQEVRSELGLPDLTFHESETYQADRALFWFTCITLKVRAGEIGNVDINIGDVLEYTDSQNEYSYWFEQLRKRMSSAATSQGLSGASSTVIERDDERTYSYDQPT